MQSFSILSRYLFMSPTIPTICKTRLIPLNGSQETIQELQ